MTILDEIIAEKRREVAALGPGSHQLRTLAAARSEFRDFSSVLRRPGQITLVAEVKKASPSAGVIRTDFDPVQIAREYADAGAAALSVLTDQKFFQGRLEFLEQIRAAVDLPLLRKDFIVDEVQLHQSVAHGADAILLIVAALDDGGLTGLLRTARALGLAVLVEVHDASELDRALAAGAGIIGINNRNLHDFSVDLATTEELAGKIAQLGNPGQRPVVVAESGIHRREDVERLAAAGVDAILVGESLMRSGDVRGKIKELLNT